MYFELIDMLHFIFRHCITLFNDHQQNKNVSTMWDTWVYTACAYTVITSGIAGRHKRRELRDVRGA